MKKQYKHKNTGKIVEWINNRFYVKATNEVIPEWMIYEGDDWELVKDYEILQTQLKKGFVYDDSYLFGNEDKWDITQVKRLKDDKTFTVGQEIKFYDNNSSSKIKAFYIDSYKELIVVVESGFNLNISLISEKIEPLFITEDGVPIYTEKTTTYRVTKDFVLLTSVSTSPYKESLLFSTKELAEEYILNNKPYFSINDVNKHLALLGDNERGLIINLLKNLVSKK